MIAECLPISRPAGSGWAQAATRRTSLAAQGPYGGRPEARGSGGPLGWTLPNRHLKGLIFIETKPSQSASVMRVGACRTRVPGEDHKRLKSLVNCASSTRREQRAPMVWAHHASRSGVSGQEAREPAARRPGNPVRPGRGGARSMPMSHAMQRLPGPVDLPS
jgi:hypothetical protein